MDFELPDELRMFKELLRRFVNNELIPVERQTVAAEGEEIKPEYLGKISPARQGPRHLDDGGAGRISAAPACRWFSARVVTEELSRTIALPRARRRHHRAVGAPHPLSAHRRAEGKISDAGAARREEGRLRADRAGCRLRSRRHAHHRRARRRSLRHQRHQALHHRRQQGRLHAAHGGDRPRQGLARRHFLLPRRHGHARREARHLLPDHDGRPAVGDRPRQRAQCR